MRSSIWPFSIASLDYMTHSGLAASLTRRTSIVYESVWDIPTVLSFMKFVMKGTKEPQHMKQKKCSVQF